MKRFICIAACFGLLLAGCSGSDSTDTEPSTEAVVNTTAVTVSADIPVQEVMYAVSVPSISESTLADDGTVIFSYTHQNMHLTLPEQDVADKVIIDFLTRVDAASSSVEALRKSAQNAYTGIGEWTPYLYSITYNPMRMDEGVLSLFGSCVTYSGGSHPDRISTAASYDLVTGDMLTLGSIMSASATTDDFCTLVLNALKEFEDEKYLYEGYENTVRQRFQRDESQDEDWYFSTTGLCFYFAPYEIAPYSSGVVVAEIPYAQLTGLLYEGYFPPERQNPSGDIMAVVLENEDDSRFSQIAELVLNPDEEMVFLYTDGILWDVTVEYGASDTTGNAFAAVYTVLFSGTLTPGDAIKIQTDELSSLRIRYFNGETTVTQRFNESENSITLASVSGI